MASNGFMLLLQEQVSPQCELTVVAGHTIRVGKAGGRETGESFHASGHNGYSVGRRFGRVVK